MSHFRKGVTQMNDLDTLAVALERMGIKPKLIERHANPQRLSGYDAAANQSAHIIVRKDNIQALSEFKNMTVYNDIGFKQEKDGTISSLLDSMNFGNSDWANRLGTYYNVERSKKAYKVAGIACFEEQDKQGRIVIKAKMMA